MLGTGAWNLRNWECGRHGIQVSYYPRIIQFLGYKPLPVPGTRGQEIRSERLARGWSRLQLGRRARVDEATVRRIETDTSRLARGPLERVLKVLRLTGAAK
jgi:hypothetical protein